MLWKIWDKYSYVILLFIITFLSFYLIVDQMKEENVIQEDSLPRWEIVVNDLDQKNIVGK